MPSDGLLTSPDREEALSGAYVRAVAASAGYAVADWDFDRDGIDLEIKAGGAMRPALGLQLKATINLGTPEGGNFRYRLKRRNYDLLRLPAQTPRLLVALALPRNEPEWLEVTAEALVLRRCAYWVSLADQPDVPNVETITISIPSGQQFDRDALRMLMEKSRRGETL